MNETFSLQVCSDCLMMMANGDLGGEGDPDAHAARMDAEWPSEDGWHLSPGDLDEPGFSWNQCDACSSMLGGDRSEAFAMRESKDL